MSGKTLHQIAYEAYAEDADWQTFDGRPMPEWGDLTDAVREHWDAAVSAVITEVLEDRRG